MKQLIICLLLTVPGFALAQDKKKSKISFQSITQAGLLQGESGGAFQIQTINGIRYKTFSAGAGIGIDDYYLRSIPVFLDVRKELKKGATPFVYADGGVHYIWAKQKSEWVEYEQPGMFYDLGIGYRLPVKGAALVFSAGYSFKSYTLTRPYYPWIWNDELSDKRTYEYELRRISMKIGLSF